MVTKQNTAEGGTNTTAVTTGNSGGASGDAWSAFGGTVANLTFTTSQAAHGSLSYRVACTSGATAFYVYNTIGASSIAFRFYFRFSAQPNALTRLVDILDTASANMVRVQVNSSNQLQLLNAAAATTVKTFTNTIAANTWYRVELGMSAGTSGATLNMDWYAGDSSSPVEAGYASTTSNNGSANNVNILRLGSIASTTFIGDIFLDDIAYTAGTTSYIGSVNVSPTAGAGVDFTTKEPYTTMVIQGTDADSDGTVVSRLWSVSPSTGVTLARQTTPSVTMTFPGKLTDQTYTITYTVTDNLGATGTDTMTVEILATNTRAVRGGVEVPVSLKLTQFSVNGGLPNNTLGGNIISGGSAASAGPESVDGGTP